MILFTSLPLDELDHKFLQDVDNLILCIFEWLTMSYDLEALELFSNRRLIQAYVLQNYVSTYEDILEEDLA